jgi:hypothetical protein
MWSNRRVLPPWVFPALLLLAKFSADVEIHLLIPQPLPFVHACGICGLVRGCGNYPGAETDFCRAFYFCVAFK